MKNLEYIAIPLLEWYVENARRLPWRSDPAPYHVWLSEIMLQQTRVAAVLGYYERFLREVPTVAALAALPEERLLKLWEGLGYYNRARNLQKAAKQVMERFGGEFPRSYEDIHSLSGVGDYTAGAIASIAFGIPVPAVDGNVLRVIARVSGDGGDISTPAMKQKITGALTEIIPANAPGDFNQALMELGATVCLPGGVPQCERCPVEAFCAARLENRVDELPVKGVKRPRRIEERTVWLIFYEGKVALRRRPDSGLLAGLWEFPNELSGTAILEQWGIESLSDEFGCEAKHIFTHIEWHMTARVVWAGKESLPEGWAWVAPGELAGIYPLPNAFKGVRHLVENNLEGGTTTNHNKQVARRRRKDD